jgi:predicted metalloendopeptidase
MDPKADPRRDFVRYASGAWLDHTPIPASEGDAGRFGELAHQLDQRLLRIIHDASRQHAAVGTPVQQVGDFTAPHPTSSAGTLWASSPSKPC